MSLAGLTTLVSQVTEPSYVLLQSTSILLSLPVALLGLRSHPSDCAWADEAPKNEIINRTEALSGLFRVIGAMSEPPLCPCRPLIGAVVSNFLQKQIKLPERIVFSHCDTGKFARRLAMPFGFNAT